MAQLRRPPAPADGGAVPEPPDDGTGMPQRLRRFVHADWIDHDEMPPGGPGSSPWYDSAEKIRDWQNIRAFRRFLDAGRQWAQDRGLDYADTFHPEWRRWREPSGGGG